MPPYHPTTQAEDLYSLNEEVAAAAAAATAAGGDESGAGSEALPSYAVGNEVSRVLRYGTVWYGMVRSGTVLYGMIPLRPPSPGPPSHRGAAPHSPEGWQAAAGGLQLQEGLRCTQKKFFKEKFIKEQVRVINAIWSLQHLYL